MSNLKTLPSIVFLLVAISSSALVACQNNSPKDKLVPVNGDEQVKTYEDAIAP
jgi:hypothetical protein